jgi:hypothetical protein
MTNKLDLELRDCCCPVVLSTWKVAAAMDSIRHKMHLRFIHDSIEIRHLIVSSRKQVVEVRIILPQRLQNVIPDLLL